MTSRGSSSGILSAPSARQRSFVVRWWLNLPIRDKGLLVVVILPLATLVAAVLMPIPFTQQQQRTAALTARVGEIREVAQELLVAVVELDASSRGYALTRDPALARRVAAARQAAPEHLRRLAALLFLVEDKPILDELAVLVRREVEVADRLLSTAGGGPSADVVQQSLASGEALNTDIRTVVSRLRSQHDMLIENSARELERRRDRLRPIILITLFGGLGAALAAGWLFATGIAARINALERNAERLANGERLHYESSRGLDEIGSLDLTLRRASLRLRSRERELRDVNTRLERTVHEQMLLNRELEAFSYSVSHDLRAPLRSIDGFAQALREDAGDKLDEVSLDHLARVRNAAQRMGQLIDDLLKLSRLTRAQIQRTDVDLSQLAREVAGELTGRNPVREVTWKIADGLRAWCDPALARILLDNLLGNAWKFTSKTPDACIEFAAMPSTQPPRFVVRDNGAGFDMRYVEKLFAPFQRLHGEREFPGTGIGLATVQRIVHKHGGTVRTEAAPGRGAAFYFTLEGGDGAETVA